MSEWITPNAAPVNAASNLLNAEISRQPQYEVGKGGIEVSGNGPIQHSAPAAYTSGQEAPADNSIMATVKSPSGSMIVNRSPNGNDIVSISGMTTTISAAVAAGLLVRNHDGSFADKETPVALKDPTAAANAQAPAEKPANDTEGEPGGITFGEAGEAALQELIAGQNPGDLIKTMDSVLHHGAIDQNTINRMASMAGVEPEQMAEQVNTVWHGAYDAAADFMADLGIENEDAFQAFITADTRRNADMMEAARNFFMHNKTEGLTTMAEAYLPSMDRYESGRVKELLTAAGYEFADKPGGGINIIVSGQPVPWDVAVKQKIITFSRD